jgi:hypothetical protein
MSSGIVYFARNNTGVKLAFTTRLTLHEAINNINISQISNDFVFVNARIFRNPKRIKRIISDELYYCNINRDIYDISDEDIEDILNRMNGINHDDILNLEPNNYEYEDELSDDDESDIEYEVEKIIAHKGTNVNNIKFKIRWLGYDKKYDTFEPICNLHNSKDILECYIIDNLISSNDIVRYVRNINN